MDSIKLYRLYEETKTTVERDCPSAPCVACILNNKCQSFLDYRKKHPEYDAKYASYVVAHKALVDSIDEAKQRSLCAVDERKQVSQQGSPLKRAKETKRRTQTMRIDFSDVKELESRTAPEGVGDFTIIKAEEKRSKAGTLMLVVDSKDADGAFVRDRICLEGAGAFRATQFFNAIGVTAEEAENMDAADLVGTPFTAEIVHEEYEDKVFAKVKKYIA